MDDFDTILRRLAIRDDRYIESVLVSRHESARVCGLNARDSALGQLGALIALDAAAPSYMEVVESAHAAGVSPAEIVGVLVALVPVVGVARAVSAAPSLALALGYDVDSALEEPAPPVTRRGDDVGGASSLPSARTRSGEKTSRRLAPASVHDADEPDRT